MREIYMRDPTDPNYQSGILEISNELEMLINQIRMILFTRPGDILGAPDFGIGLEDQLFSLNVNEYVIKSLLKEQVLKFVPLASKYIVNFNVNFAAGTARDICLIDVLIDGTPQFGVLVK